MFFPAHVSEVHTNPQSTGRLQNCKETSLYHARTHTHKRARVSSLALQREADTFLCPPPGLGLPAHVISEEEEDLTRGVGTETHPRREASGPGFTLVLSSALFGRSRRTEETSVV